MNPATTANPLKKNPDWERRAVAALLLVGVVLRLRQYLTGRSLWVDEAMLALNVVNRSLAGLFQPLDYDQGAPLGFLLVEKLFQLLLGKHELVLRLFPLLVGLLSLGLFALLLRRMEMRGAGGLTALALFALNPRLIYYSSEVKQYILDAAVTVALLLVAAPLFDAAPRRREFAWLALAGCAALWFSHPALFVLAGLGLALLIFTLQRRRYPDLPLVLGMGLLWLLTVGLLYFLILQDLRRNAYMREYWAGAFVPLPPWSDPGWFADNLRANIGVQFAAPYGVWLVFALMLAGWVLLWLRRREYGAAFAGILLVTLAASSLGFYPVAERMILFLVPLGLVLLGAAVEGLARGLANARVPRLLAVAGLIGFLIYGPLVTSAQSFLAPKYFEHIRPSLEALREARKEGDALYVSYGALPAFRFYAPFYGLEGIPYAYGERRDYQTPQTILDELRSFEGQPRVWVLFSHVYQDGDFNEREFVLEYLDRAGKRKREVRMPGTSVFLYLYDLEQ